MGWVCHRLAGKCLSWTLAVEGGVTEAWLYLGWFLHASILHAGCMGRQAGRVGDARVANNRSRSNAININIKVKINISISINIIIRINININSRIGISTMMW